MNTIQEQIRLDGRVALVTGAAGHVGQVLIRSLAELGADVLVADMNELEAKKIAATCRSEFGVDARELKVDLESEASILESAEIAKAWKGRMDILIHSAALLGTSELAGWAVPFENQNYQTWVRAMRVNLDAVFILTQALTPLMQQAANPSIITISSIYGMVGPDFSLYAGTTMGNPAAYAASKGGLIQLSRWFATALAPKIRVNSISLGGIWRNQSEAFHSRYIEKTPLGRMGSEDDVKGAVAYLAGDLSSYVTGHNLVIDGGWTAW